MFKNYAFFSNPIRVIAHRGDSKYFPENSLVAFDSAIKLGVDVIETDVHISSDGQIFVWHDENTFQLDQSKQPVSERSWADLKELDLGFLYVDKDGHRPFSSKGIGLVLFKDVLKKFPKTRFNVDLKDESRALVEGFYSILESENAFDRVTVASFHSSNLKTIRAISPRVVTSYGRSEVRRLVVLSKLNLLRFVSKYIALPPVIQIPEVSGSTVVLTKYLIKVLHKRGVKVQVWTINDEEDMIRLYKMGVDGVMTDDPRLLLGVVENLYSRS